MASACKDQGGQAWLDLRQHNLLLHLQPPQKRKSTYAATAPGMHQCCSGNFQEEDSERLVCQSGFSSPDLCLRIETHAKLNCSLHVQAIIDSLTAEAEQRGAFGESTTRHQNLTVASRPLPAGAAWKEVQVDFQG